VHVLASAGARLLLLLRQAGQYALHQPWRRRTEPETYM
jgi:hypothetical protein